MSAKCVPGQAPEPEICTTSVGPRQPLASVAEAGGGSGKGLALEVVSASITSREPESSVAEETLMDLGRSGMTRKSLDRLTL
ncbi:hypothetical protein scyTo_0005407 [Scyliorhinus torazame]|uniref:Uncharacterized protein n=1 Tax=Scyliorhinus torazame TaxID=75743 RepID=A0A401P7I5_SCYTO|nr:hypothetical protein [Scyliorhinus torazame]